jgi:serine protease
MVALAMQPARSAAQGPPFASGQVAVYADAADLAGATILKELPHAGITVIAASPGRELAEARQLVERGFRAGPNRIATAATTPNDPVYSFQWHFNTVQAPAAWDVTIGTGVTVAILDSGLATVGSSDGIGCVMSPRDVVNGDNDPVDGDGHGTHVAGTVGQATNNATGVAGLAHGSCIMPVKVLDDSGSGAFADIADGIVYAVDHGAKVINMSLSTNARFGLSSDPIVDPALEYAYANGVTVVAAAGNDGYRKNVGYPALHPKVIGVGATDYGNKVPRYSNRGTGLDLVAPGGDLSKDGNGDGYADGVLQETFDGGTWSYYFFQGTSMASPHVAAAAALLIASGTATTPDAVRSALTDSTLDLGSAGFDSTHGWGLLQVADALGAPPSCTDGDGDGYCDDVDCDDANGAINPGATEICDGIDNDCDGLVDEGCGGCTDADGDGYCVSEGDCDDNDANVHPGHNDTRGRWGRDGVDNDCNGVIDG